MNLTRRAWLAGLAALAFAPPARAQVPARARLDAPGLALFQALLAPDGSRSVALSPHGIGVGLAMLLAGARGPTRRLLRRALGAAARSPAALAAQRAALTATGAPSTRVLAAAAAWLQRGAAPTRRFAAALRTAFDAPVETLDFAAPDAGARINAWVAARTEHKITEIVDRLDPATAFVLANVLFFKGAWAAPFDPALTRPGEFRRADGTARPARLMRLTLRADYVEDGALHAVVLPYAGERLEMLLVTSRAQDQAAALHRPDGKAWAEYVPGLQLRPRTVEVVLPRFALQAGQDLMEPLRATPLGPALRQGADYRGIAGRRVLPTAFLHKVAVEVNEEGTTAAAATAVVGQRSLPPSFEADRPFAFMVRHRPTGTVLFAGFVADPGE